MKTNRNNPHMPAQSSGIKCMYTWYIFEVVFLENERSFKKNFSSYFQFTSSILSETPCIQERSL